MLVLTILEKNQRNEIKIFSGEWNSIIKDGELSRSKSETKNAQLNKLKSAAKNKTRTILRLNKKNFEVEESPHELCLTTRQTTKIRNAFANNMPTDIKLSKTQISKIIQSGGSFGSWLGNLRKKALTDIAIPLARDNLPGLVINLTSNAISKF